MEVHDASSSTSRKATNRERARSLRFYQRQEFCADGLFSHTKAEAVLQQLFDTVSEQQNEIDRLRNEVSDLRKSVKERSSDEGGVEENHKTRNSIGKSRLSLKERVEWLEKCTAIPESDSGTSLTVGEEVILNKKALAKALQALSSKVSVEDLLNFQAAQRQLLNEAKRDLCDEQINKETMLGLSDCISAINEKLDVISSDLQSKAEKASLRSIQMDASLIRDRIKFFQNIEEEMNSIHHKMKQASMQLDDNSSYIADLSAFSKSCREELGNKVGNNEFNEMIAKMDDIRNDLNKLTDESTEANVLLKCTTNDICKLFKGYQELQMFSESRWQKCSDSLQGTYSKAEIDSMLSQMFVCKTEFEVALHQVKDDLNKKAWDSSVADQRRMIDNLILDHANTKRAASIATKFVDWYSRRGESFEHNAQTIDNELKRLAKRSIH